jgi:hypothetical protein
MVPIKERGDRFTCDHMRSVQFLDFDEQGIRFRERWNPLVMCHIPIYQQLLVFAGDRLMKGSSDL